MEQNAFDDMLASLPVSRRRKRSIARELQAHLEDTRHELERAGWSPDAAIRESEARLGDLDEIAHEFDRVYRPNRRTRVGLAFGLAGALLLGAYGSGSLASATSAHKPTPTAHVTTTTQPHRSHHS